MKYIYFSVVFIILLSVLLFFGLDGEKKIISTENRFYISQELRRSVASSLIIGDSIDKVLQNFAEDNFKDFDPRKYLHELDLNKGRSTCGLAASILTKLLNEKGIEAYTYNFGFTKTLSHVVVLVRVEDYPVKWIVQDPFFNYTIVDSLDNTKDFFELLSDLNNKNIENIQIIEDTIIQKVLLQNQTKQYLLRSKSSNCMLEINNKLLNYQNRLSIQNCYTCLDAINCDQWNFKKQFGEELKNLGYPSDFIFGYLLQINKLWGPNPNILQKRIDSILKIKTN